ncbi:hypothetical protein AB0L68_12895 [Streptomyces sp. NPDC052164]|uniref:hypothetical protein n=1 Tax=Streptomyces sp. NPDC052164 TaxID=3155529 RepID=UPI0034180E91
MIERWQFRSFKRNPLTFDQSASRIPAMPTDRAIRAMRPIPAGRPDPGRPTDPTDRPIPTGRSRPADPGRLADPTDRPIRSADPTDRSEPTLTVRTEEL